MVAGVVLLSVACCFLLLAHTAAVRPATWQEHPGMHVPAVGSGRNILQDALSNSNGCLDTIPKCEQGACATRNIMGVARWTCLRCLANYEPVVDGSGQDNIIQCVCPKGTFEANSTATSCTRCTANSFCPGGDRVEAPASRGSLMPCGSGMVTRNTGARSAADCLAPAGYAMSSPTAASACARSEYAPQFNRLTKCMKCQGGLEEPLGSNLTDGLRSSKRTVCKVPPGRYVSQGLVRVCPQGFYRENYTDFDAAVSQKCLPCNPGITTAGAGARLASECNVVLPGYGIDNVYNITGANSVPALPTNSSGGLPGATVCDIGFYAMGGYCVQCAGGTVTRVKGAQSVEQCVVPPGYYLPSATMVQCDTGFFREGWLMASDPKATSCTACGDNILSEPRDLDEHPLATNSSLVRATSASCYIEPGQGMMATGKNLFVAKDCPENTYGVSGRVYGLYASPCKPCPRNMITDGVSKATSSDTCINPDGFGYASEGASRCAPGFYAAKGTRKACTRCPPGRTTQDDPRWQRYLSDCDVAPGYGVAAGNPANGDIFAGDVASLSEQQILDLMVLLCPTGYWGGGDSLAATCTKCPAGSTTKQSGSTTPDQCNVCLAGLGKVNATAPCTPCEYGFWQPGGLAECLPCPNSTFYPPIDGIGAPYTSQAATFSKGATGVEWCVPLQSQLSPEAGQAYFNKEFTVTTAGINTLYESPASSLDACLAKCQYDLCCMAQYDVAAGSCKYALLPPAADDYTGAVMFYKLPPSTLSAASSLHRGNSTSGGSSHQVMARSTATSSRAPRIVPGSYVTLRIRKQQGSDGSTRTQSVQPRGSQRVRAKTLASGLYAKCKVPEGEEAAWARIGTTLTTDARTFAKGPAVWLTNVTDVQVCQELCDNSNVCWGGFFQDGRCLFRGGEDALKMRSFFALPTPGTAPGLFPPPVADMAYYFTFTGANGSALQTPDATKLTLFSQAVETALQVLTPFPDATVGVFVQSGGGNSSAVEIGFQFFDADFKAINTDLSALFVSNATTTALVAKSLLDIVLQDGADAALAVITSGLYLASSDGAQGLLDVPIRVDGCVLLPGYCGVNGGGSCTLNVCQCQAGWTGPRCTQSGAATLIGH